MPELTQEELEQALTELLDQLRTIAQNKEKLHHNFYSDLYPDDYSEIDFSDAARYPELRPLVVQVVEQIIQLFKDRRVSSIWIDDENQAGSHFTSELVRYDKKYCGLFADCLALQDLDHEVHQNDDIESILYKWGLCDETALILQAREENSGQHGREFIAQMREEYGEALDAYLPRDEYDEDFDDEEDD